MRDKPVNQILFVLFQAYFGLMGELSFQVYWLELIREHQVRIFKNWNVFNGL